MAFVYRSCFGCWRSRCCGARALLVWNAQMWKIFGIWCEVPAHVARLAVAAPILARLSAWDDGFVQIDALLFIAVIAILRVPGAAEHSAIWGPGIVIY